jgi:hypothetical protein
MVILESDEAKLIVSLIDTCADRGAIKGEEMYTVGVIRSNLITKLREEESTKNEGNGEGN